MRDELRGHHTHRLPRNCRLATGFCLCLRRPQYLILMVATIFHFITLPFYGATQEKSASWEDMPAIVGRSRRRFYASIIDFLFPMQQLPMPFRVIYYGARFRADFLLDKFFIFIFGIPGIPSAITIYSTRREYFCWLISINRRRGFWQYNFSFSRAVRRRYGWDICWIATLLFYLAKTSLRRWINNNLNVIVIIYNFTKCYDPQLWLIPFFNDIYLFSDNATHGSDLYATDLANCWWGRPTAYA